MKIVCFVLSKAKFHIIYHQFTVNSFNTENSPADTNNTDKRWREEVEMLPPHLLSCQQTQDANGNMKGEDKCARAYMSMIIIKDGKI